jgi:hypothetical protein
LACGVVVKGSEGSGVADIDASWIEVAEPIGKTCRFEVAFAKPSTNTASGSGSAQWGRDGYEQLKDCQTQCCS